MSPIEPPALPLRYERRQFEPGPYVLGLELGPKQAHFQAFPFTLPLFLALERLRFDASVTLLSGDNGTGKSTVLETVAASMGFAEEGGELDRSGERPARPIRLFDDSLSPVLTLAKPRHGYFLRAESFYNVAAFVGSGDVHAPDLSLYGDRGLHEQSHGESFLALASNRFGPEGLYLLDEPEAALSVTGALALLAIIARAAAGGAQFILATHSPILLACPGATIYEFSGDDFEAVSYDDLEVVRLYRGFLAAPERFLRSID